MISKKWGCTISTEDKNRLDVEPEELVEETYLLKVCERIKMDLLEKILSGKDPGKQKNGCVSRLFEWETPRFPLPTKSL